MTIKKLNTIESFSAKLQTAIVDRRGQIRMDGMKALSWHRLSAHFFDLIQSSKLPVSSAVTLGADRAVHIRIGVGIAEQQALLNEVSKVIQCKANLEELRRLKSYHQPKGLWQRVQQLVQSIFETIRWGREVRPERFNAKLIKLYNAQIAKAQKRVKAAPIPEEAIKLAIQRLDQFKKECSKAIKKGKAVPFSQNKEDEPHTPIHSDYYPRMSFRAVPMRPLEKKEKSGEKPKPQLPKSKELKTQRENLVPTKTNEPRPKTEHPVVSAILSRRKGIADTPPPGTPGSWG